MSPRTIRLRRAAAAVSAAGALALTAAFTPGAGGNVTSLRTTNPSTTSHGVSAPCGNPAGSSGTDTTYHDISTPADTTYHDIALKTCTDAPGSTYHDIDYSYRVGSTTFTAPAGTYHDI